MCARYTLHSPADLLAERFGLNATPDLKARYNIAPSQLIPVIGTRAGGHGRGLALFKWGFIPHWANDDSGMKPVNARAETVATTPMFSESFRQRRCLIPADGFYEWKMVNRKKMPVHFQLKGHEPFALAGVWDVWNGPQGNTLSCAIITTTPNDLARQVHDRMPVSRRSVLGMWESGSSVAGSKDNSRTPLNFCSELAEADLPLNPPSTNRSDRLQSADVERCPHQE